VPGTGPRFRGAREDGTPGHRAISHRVGGDV